MELAGPDLLVVINDWLRVRAPAADGAAAAAAEEQPGLCVPEAAARVYGREVLEALACCHAHGIVYRDLKVRRR